MLSSGFAKIRGLGGPSMSTPIAEPFATIDREPPRERNRPGLRDLALASLWLGLVGFGGGIAVLSMIRNLVVERRRWLTERELTNTATVAQMLPGGAAANALAYMGLRFAGVRGALLAYIGFSFPGTVIILVLAWAYIRFGVAPRAELLLGGLNAAVVGLIISITLKMARSGIARLWQMAVAVGALLLTLAGGAGSGEVALLGIGSGLILDLGTKRVRLARWHFRHLLPPPVALPEEGHPLAPSGPPPVRQGDQARQDGRSGTPPATLPVLAAVPAGVVAALLQNTLVQVALVFFLTGMGAYGGGFAIIPHLQGALASHGWLTDRQFVDAVAIGKLTPGPVLLMATFIGYLVGRLPGALVATVAIFAAPFLLVVTLGFWLDRMRSRRLVRAALRGLTPAVVGLMAAAALTLGGSLSGGAEIGIAAAVALALSRFSLNPILILALAGAARVGLHAIGLSSH